MANVQMEPVKLHLWLMKVKISTLSRNIRMVGGEANLVQTKRTQWMQWENPFLIPTYQAMIIAGKGVS